MRVFQTLPDLAACVDQHVATSDWVTITQAQIQQFAQATGDQQWIHVDVTLECEGAPKPVCVAQSLLRLYP